MSIPLFGGVGFCPKCGANGNGASREYHGGRSDAVNEDLRADYMIVRCRYCTYAWYERCRDYVPPITLAEPTVEELAQQEVDAIAPS